MQKAGIPAFFIAHYFPLITFFMAPFPWGWLANFRDHPAALPRFVARAPRPYSTRRSARVPTATTK